MSHTGNWQGNPRKLALEIERQRERESLERQAADLAEKVAREGGHVVTFYDHGPDVAVMGLTPCTTFNFLQLAAEVTCSQCRARRPLTWPQLAHTRLSHTPWPQVMPMLTCKPCGGARPEAIYFKSEGGGQVRSGCLSIRPPEKRRSLL